MPNGSSSTSDADTSGSRDERWNRMLQLAIHEDLIFYNRLNFFAVIETVLLAAVASSSAAAGRLLHVLLLVMGLLVTIMWSVAQIRSRRYVRVLVRRLKTELPELKDGFNGTDLELRQIRVEGASEIMTYGLPTMFALAWLVLLGDLLYK